MEKYKIYLDDLRTPIDQDWIVVRDYEEFVNKVTEIGFENIELVSLDHDLADIHYNTDLYDTIIEKTGYDCAKWLIEKWQEGNTIFDVYTHSANTAGAKNIVELINSYRRFIGMSETCGRVKIQHDVKYFSIF